LPRIVVLDEITANQIAAGEVVERPASVVKELLENAFDAGASKVSVEIRGGGRDEIKVTDNGCGMDETDSETAFQRHATSKINNINDINDIRSLGFRGEALPSIAAVSKVVLITRPPDTDSGTRLTVQGGRLLSRSPAGCPAGTSIIVSDLFYNTPARLKYMKTKSAESGQISDVVTRLAMARPDISIKLENEGRTSFHSTGTGHYIDALAAVYGAETAKEFIPIEGAEDQVSIKGLIASPLVSRSSKKHITVIINGRYVRNPLINTAVLEGYGTLLTQGRFPLGLISVKLDPGFLDVNVHPSKMVVRISGESKLFNLVKRTVMAALRTEKIIPGFSPEADYGTQRSDYTGSLSVSEKSVPPHPIPEPPQSVFVSPGQVPRVGQTVDHRSLSPMPGLFVPVEKLLETIYPIGFLPPTYILAGSINGLFIIDHHAAHERILYEKFLGMLNNKKVNSQILLVPSVVQLSPREFQIAEGNLDYICSLGIQAQFFGSNSLVIREIPAEMTTVPVEDVLRDLLEYLYESGQPVHREELIKKMATSAACRAAIKSGTKSAMEEAWSIIRGLADADVPYTCPHGRPTMININDHELKTRFKRT